MLGQEPLHAFRRAIEDDGDVVVPSLPGIPQELAQARLVVGGQGVSEPIKGLPEWGPPGLMPRRVPARLASTVTPPPLDPVGTAPGGVLDDLDEVRRAVLFELFPIVREAREIIGVDVIEGIRQGHVAMPVVVAIGLTVGGDMDQLRPRALLREGA